MVSLKPIQVAGVAGNARRGMRKLLTFVATGWAAVAVASSAQAARCTTAVDPQYVFARDHFTAPGTTPINLSSYTTLAPGIPANSMNWTKIGGLANLRVDPITGTLAPQSTNDG